MLLYGVLAAVSIIGIFFLLRGNASPYKKTIPASFSPLNHLEIKQRKPFIWKLAKEGDKVRWVYECNLMRTNNLSVLWQNKDTILKTVENTKMEFSLEYIIIYLTKLMWQIGKKPRGLIKRIQFKSFFFDYCFKNIEATVNVFNDLLDYQTRLFFLLKKIQEKLITQQEEYTGTDGDLSLPGEMAGPRYMSNIFQNWNFLESKTPIEKKPPQNQPKSPKPAKKISC